MCVLQPSNTIFMVFDFLCITSTKKCAYVVLLYGIQGSWHLSHDLTWSTQLEFRLGLKWFLISVHKVDQFVFPCLFMLLLCTPKVGTGGYKCYTCTCSQVREAHYIQTAPDRNPLFSMAAGSPCLGVTQVSWNKMATRLRTSSLCLIQNHLYCRPIVKGRPGFNCESENFTFSTCSIEAPVTYVRYNELFCLSNTSRGVFWESDVPKACIPGDPHES